MARVVLSVTLGLWLATSGFAWASDLTRHAGRVQSMIPAAGVLVIEEFGARGQKLVKVDIRDAEVVRLWRDSARPWEWQERPARVQRLSVGTFVVVIGRTQASGTIEADRIEVPKVESD